MNKTNELCKCGHKRVEHYLKVGSQVRCGYMESQDKEGNVEYCSCEKFQPQNHKQEELKPIMRVFSKERFRQLSDKYEFTTSMINDKVRNAKNMDVLVLQTQFRNGKHWIDNAWILNEESPEVFMELMFGSPSEENHSSREQTKQEYDSAQGVNHLGDGKAIRSMLDKTAPLDTTPLSEKIFTYAFNREGDWTEVDIGDEYFLSKDVRQAVLRLKEEIWKHGSYFERIKCKTSLRLDYIDKLIEKHFGSSLTEKENVGEKE